MSADRDLLPRYMRDRQPLTSEQLDRLRADVDRTRIDSDDWLAGTHTRSMVRRLLATIDTLASPPVSEAADWARYDGRVEAFDAMLAYVRHINGNVHDEPSEPALDTVDAKLRDLRSRATAARAAARKALAAPPITPATTGLDELAREIAKDWNGRIVTGEDIRSAIDRATPLVDPRLSEVDWDEVAGALRLATPGESREPEPR